jgi:hypothetical protein
MAFINLEGKNNKLKLVFAGILFMAMLFLVKLLFFPSVKNAGGLLPIKLSDIADIENIKIGQINSDLFSSPKIKNLQEYQVKIMKIEDIKKGNENPFAGEIIKGETGEIDRVAADKLFAEYSASFGVELNEPEKAECLNTIAAENAASDKYSEIIKLCFAEKRNRILGQ